jgi:uncharacterized protein YfaP (DUF2135 family)
VRIGVVIGGLVIFAVVSYVMRTVKEFPANAIPVVTVGLTGSIAYDVLLALTKRTTEVREDALIVRSRPLPSFLNRAISLQDIAQLVTQGSNTVQVRLSSGQSVAIRTAKADELTAAIQARMK